MPKWSSEGLSVIAFLARKIIPTLIFSIQTSLLNISHLLHKMGFVPTEVGTTVA